MATRVYGCASDQVESYREVHYDRKVYSLVAAGDE